MPNDSTGQFPLPPETTGEGRAQPPNFNQPPMEPTPAREVKLTDEVAPILSAPGPELQVRNLQSTAGSEPTSTPPPSPATLPSSSGRNFPVVTLLLLLIAISAIAATYFFYQQAQTLTAQLSEIERTLEQQKIRENQLTTTPTLALEIIETPPPTPISTASATVTLTISPAPTGGRIFDQIAAVLTIAQGQYPNAQLILIRVENGQSPDQMITKYWFRQSLTDKKYLYVMREPGKDLVLLDEPGLRVTPDSDIPPLNQPATTGQLGIDLPEAINLAVAVCPTNFDCHNTPISAQYIKANTALWQINYTPAIGERFVVQIDSLTKKILFKNQ